MLNPIGFLLLSELLLFIDNYKRNTRALQEKYKSFVNLLQIFTGFLQEFFATMVLKC